MPLGTDTAALSAYLQNATTTYFYCYDGFGELSMGVAQSKLAAETGVACG